MKPTIPTTDQTPGPVARLRTATAAMLTRAEGVLRNLSWMLVSELMARASRLVTIITLAAMLDMAGYGIAMLALVCHELMRIFTRIGSGAKLIQCQQQELESFAGNAYTLNWLICLSVAAIQFAVAPLIAQWYDAAELTGLLRIMALSYLIYPVVAIRVFLLQRNNQMKYYSLCSGLSITVDNLGTALLVVLGFGIESVAYAKVLAALVWVLAFAFADVDRYAPRFSPAVMLVLMSFSSRVLGSELLRTLRNQADLLIAGRILAPELLGIYSFAKSAGIGLAQSLGNAFLAAIYPRLSDYHRRGDIASGSQLVLVIAAAVGLVFIAQSMAAFIYVPLLFDAQWHEAAGLVAVLCLSAIPALLVDTSALIHRVQYQLNTECLMQLIAVATLVGGLLLLTPHSPKGFALSTTALSMLWLLPCAASYLGRRYGVQLSLRSSLS